MNPLRWIRWKVLTGFLLVFAIVYFVGVDGMLLRKINTEGETAPTARWRIADLALGLVVGEVKLGDILLVTPHAEARSTVTSARTATPSAESGKEQVFHAKCIEVNTSVAELLRGRYVVDEITVQVPRLSIQRREDGSTNVGAIGGSPEENREVSPASDTDWVSVLEEWWGRIKQWHRRIPRGDDEEEGERADAPPMERPGGFADYSQRVDYPFAGRPDVVLRQARVEGLEVEFEDAGAAVSLPRFTNGVVVLEEFSSKPSVQEKPSRFSALGTIAGARLELTGTLDFSGDDTHLEFDVELAELPVSVIEAFLGKSLPVELVAGSIDLTSTVVLSESSLLVAPRLEFTGVQLVTKEGEERIAGLSAAEFVRAFNDASDILETIVIADLKISGTLDAPSFEWGDSVRQLVMAGGQAFAKKQLEVGIGKGREILKEKVGKLSDAFPLSDELKERLEGAGKVLDGSEPLKSLPFGLKNDGE